MKKTAGPGEKAVWCGCAVGMTTDNRLVSVVSIQCRVDVVRTLCVAGECSTLAQFTTVNPLVHSFPFLRRYKKLHVKNSI